MPILNYKPKRRVKNLFQFITQYHLPNIKFKLTLLYLLNISDIILTLILLKTGLIIEANPIMAYVIQNKSATILVKGILPGLLFMYLYLRLKSASIQMTKVTNYCLILLIVFYFLINCLHLIWFTLLPWFSY